MQAPPYMQDNFRPHSNQFNGPMMGAPMNPRHINPHQMNHQQNWPPNPNPMNHQQSWNQNPYQTNQQQQWQPNHNQINNSQQSWQPNLNQANPQAYPSNQPNPTQAFDSASQIYASRPPLNQPPRL